jgi:hypothetical protein
MEWERWTVKSRRKKESVDDGIRYTIKNCEQNRHHLEYPMSATEVIITHYRMDRAKFILDKMAIPYSAYGYKKIILQRVDNTHSTIIVMYNLLHSTTPVTHIAVTSRPPPTNRCTRSPRALSRRPADSMNGFLRSTALRGVCHRRLTIQGGVSPASPISRLSMGTTSLKTVRIGSLGRYRSHPTLSYRAQNW